MSDDPERLANQLLQCLTQDKKPIGLLLGAGCPYSIKDESNKPLIPDIKGLTEAVKERLNSKGCKDHWGIIYSQLEEDGLAEPNIEDILSRVRGLKEYVGIGTVRGLNKVALEGLESDICNEIVDCVRKELPDKNTPYHNLASWIGSIDRAYSVEIFTTNYDLLIEQAFEDLRIPFFDGFVGARQPFFDAYAVEFDALPSRWAKLWKVHGSINWRGEIVDDGFKVWRTDTEKGGDVVIHPSHLKYDQSRKMPYLAMMDRLRKFLSTPSSALIIVGYSFGDQHLNDVIVQSLQGSPSTAVFALMYGQLSNYEEAVNLAKERANLTVIGKNGVMIGTKEQYWKKLDEEPEPIVPAGAVEWSKSTEKGDSWEASFKLGDFVSFGAFLQDIAGKGSLRSL